MNTDHDHRNKDGSIRVCTHAVAHLVGPEGGPLTWCNHGEMNPDVGYCVHSGTARAADGLRLGTPCDDPWNARGEASAQAAGAEEARRQSRPDDVT